MGDWQCPGLPSQGCKPPTRTGGGGWGQSIPEEWGRQLRTGPLNSDEPSRSSTDLWGHNGAHWREAGLTMPTAVRCWRGSKQSHQPRETSGRGCSLRKMSDIPHPPHDWLLIYTPALGPFLTFLQIALMSPLLSNAAPIFRGFALAFLGCTVPARDLLSSKANYLLRFLLLSLFINSWFLSQKWAHLGC